MIRYAYRRSKPGGFWQHTLIEPSSKVPGETKAIWMKKRLDDCILRGDNECAFKNGTIVDMPIVRVLLMKIANCFSLTPFNIRRPISVVITPNVLFLDLPWHSA